MTEELIVEITDGIHVITINRPQARNAVNLAVTEAMAAAITEKRKPEWKGI
jgi:enoyl-CoA hydratase